MVDPIPTQSSRSKPNLNPIPTQSLPNPSQTLLKPQLNPTQTLPDLTQTLLKPYPNRIQTLPKLYPNHTRPDPNHKNEICNIVREMFTSGIEDQKATLLILMRILELKHIIDLNRSSYKFSNLQFS